MLLIVPRPRREILSENGFLYRHVFLLKNFNVCLWLFFQKFSEKNDTRVLKRLVMDTNGLELFLFLISSSYYVEGKSDRYGSFTVTFFATTLFILIFMISKVKNGTTV